jgi:hypothetical protein
MIGKPRIHRCEVKDLLGIVETPVSDVAHERQNDIYILPVDVILAFQPLADQTQDFQSTEHNLMLSRTCCRLHGRTS